MFNKAGIAMINENNKVRIPFAPLISRSTLPILATLTYKKQYIIYIFGKFTSFKKCNKSEKFIQLPKLVPLSSFLT